MADIKNEIPDQEYAYGFNDGDVSVFKTPKGINEEITAKPYRGGADLHCGGACHLLWTDAHVQRRPEIQG